MISLLQLGCIDYATGLRLQQRLVELRKEGRIGDVLLLLEHTPVITLGRNAKASNVIASPERLSERGVEVFDCDRGGDVTFHGPGQLVGYPIFDLRGFPSTGGTRKTLGVIEYVRGLEEVLIRTCADCGIPTKRVAGLTGVWTSPEIANSLSSRAEQSGPDKDRSAQSRDPLSPPEAKIAALGVHISRAVTSHGFALNVNTDLTYFDLIVPCGITSKPVTSMSKELSRELAMQDVVHSVSRNFGQVFNSQILWLETLDALLQNTVGVPLTVPSEFRRIHHEKDSFLA